VLLVLALVGVLVLLFVALTSAKAARRVVILVMVVYLALMLAVLPVIIYLWLRPVQSAVNAGAPRRSLSARSSTCCPCSWRWRS